MAQTKVGPKARELRGLQTRERLLGAAAIEFARAGMADVRAIVSAAGVAQGTFFFHFPTKNTCCMNWNVAKSSAWPSSS